MAAGCKRLGSLSKTLAVLWTQQRCSLVVEYTCVKAFQNPRAPSPVASLGSTTRPRCFHVHQQGQPRLFAFTVAVGQGDQFLVAIGRGAHQDEDALPIFFQANIEVDAVGPQVDVFLSFQGTFAPIVVFLLPRLALSRVTVEADSPAACGPTSAAKASLKSPVLTPFRYSQGISSSRLLVFRKYGGRIFEEKGSASSPRSPIQHPRLLNFHRTHAGGDRPLG